MQNVIQGGKRALLFVLAFALCGCAGRRELYVAGTVRTQETEAESGEGQPPAAQKTDVEPGEGQISVAKKTDALSGEGQPPAAQENAQGTDAPSESEGYVYVCGAVESPGVYPVREGMRVFEALELAGGFAQDADREWLNQAEPVQDGQRLYVYTQEETQKLRGTAQEAGQVLWPEGSETVPSDTTGASGTARTAPGGIPDPDGGKVNLNTAGREELKTLPGIGDAKADAIIQYRETYGPFRSIDEIQNISGIKSAVFSKIRDLIAV